MATPPPDHLGLEAAVALSGGVASAGVWRATWQGQPVVFKWASDIEVTVLDLVGSLSDPVLGTLLEHGVHEGDPWVITPFHRGSDCGLTGSLPDDVHRSMGRLHARCLDLELPEGLRRNDRRFVVEGLDEFARGNLRDAWQRYGPGQAVRAEALLDRLLADAAFVSFGEHGPQTLLHDDLYGLNVLLADHDEPLPLVIDWGTSRIGPPMKDLAYTGDWPSAARRAHDEGWREVTGSDRDATEAECELAWCQALINAMFSPVLALRGTAADAEAMLDTAERALARHVELR